MKRAVLIKKLLLLVMMLFVPSVNAAVDIVNYESKPIVVKLHVGEERIIQFGDHVSMGPTRLQKRQNLIRIQSTQGALYLHANKEFEKQRFLVKRITDGRFVLLDIYAIKKTNKKLNTIKVVMKSENKVPDQVVDVDVSEETMIGPVDLTRFAAQRFFSPKRLHKNIVGISSAPLSINGNLKLFKGENQLTTSSRPLLGWKGGGLYIAGIHIENTSSKSIKLKYTDINVPFKYATFQYHSLKPKDTSGSVTMLYLITDEPLKNALQPWTYYRDLKEQRKKDIAAAKLKQQQENEADFDEI